MMGNSDDRTGPRWGKSEPGWISEARPSMSPTWTITRLPSQTHARPVVDRSEQLKRERLASELRLAATGTEGEWHP